VVSAAALLAGCATVRKDSFGTPEVKPQSGAEQRGLASWYGEEFAGLPTASGEIFRPERVSAAHRTLPLGSIVEVRNEKNGRALRVKVTDRGPFVAGRIVDLSKAAAVELGSLVDGVVPVTLRVLEIGDGRYQREVPETETLAAAEKLGWAVQAGAFGTEENARRLRDRLAALYPSPWLEDFGGLKRVKFGPYGSREEADAARATLGQLGLAGIVVPYR